jgi:thioredoxin 1
MKRILRFTASWCQPCKTLAKNLEMVNGSHNVPIEVVDIDVHSDVAVEYGIRSVPTLIMKEENTEVKRFSGVKSTKELEDWING